MLSSIISQVLKVFGQLFFDNIKNWIDERKEEKRKKELQKVKMELEQEIKKSRISEIKRQNAKKVNNITLEERKNLLLDKLK